MSTELRAGDVLTYKSERDGNWCREGMAVVHEVAGRLIAVDTYWATSVLSRSVSPDCHVLTDAELDTASVSFNLADFEVTNAQHGSYLDYAPADRAVVTSQHGLQKTLLVRKGAKPSGSAIVRKHVDRVREARQNLESAQRRLLWAEDDLLEAFAGRHDLCVETVRP